MDEGTRKKILQNCWTLHTWFFQNSSELFKEGEKEVFPSVQALK